MPCYKSAGDFRTGGDEPGVRGARAAGLVVRWRCDQMMRLRERPSRRRAASSTLTGRRAHGVGEGAQRTRSPQPGRTPVAHGSFPEHAAPVRSRDHNSRTNVFERPREGSIVSSPRHYLPACSMSVRYCFRFPVMRKFSRTCSCPCSPRRCAISGCDSRKRI